jgi:hypothetical protein
LQKESELPIEELLKTLPKEVLENPVPIPSDEPDEEVLTFQIDQTKSPSYTPIVAYVTVDYLPGE